MSEQFPYVVRLLQDERRRVMKEHEFTEGSAVMQNELTDAIAVLKDQ